MNKSLFCTLTGYLIRNEMLFLLAVVTQATIPLETGFGKSLRPVLTRVPLNSSDIKQQFIALSSDDAAACV